MARCNMQNKKYLSPFQAHLGQGYSLINITGDQVQINWNTEFSRVICEIKKNTKMLKIFIEALERQWLSSGIPGRSLLHACAYFRNTNLIKILLTMGYDVNVVGSEGYTPLELCFKNNSENALEITKLLMEHNAKVSLAKLDIYSLFNLCTLSKPPDWVPVFYCLLQHMSDHTACAWALEVAKRNLSHVEFSELETYLQVNQNKGEEDSKQPIDDKVETPNDNVMLSVEEKSSEDKDLTEPMKQDAVNKPLTFECSHCTIVFKSSLKLQLHNMRKHNGERKFQCYLCDRKVTTATGFNIHLASHANERLSMCHICGKRFAGRSGLNKHIRVCHSGTRLFICSYCPKTFALKHSLHEHVRTHEAVPYAPFVCDTCGMRYRHKKGLARHRGKHLGEDERSKFCCLTCNKAFFRKDHFDKHLRTMAHLNLYLKSNC